MTVSGGASGESGSSAEGGAETAGGAAGSVNAGGSTGSSGSSGSSAGGAAGQAGESGVTGDLLYIKASNPDAADYFGRALAVDGKWLAVGATNEASQASGIDGDQDDDSEDGSGAVYLFSEESDGWAQRAYVKASNPGAVDSFGAVVALSGERLAVGAPHEDGSALGIDGVEDDGSGNSGAVYVFAREDGVWRQEAYVKAPNTDAIDLFGSSLALEGDTLIVGAPWEDSASKEVDGDPGDDSAENSGSVYVYQHSSNGWEHHAYLKGSHSEPDDEFGASVALSAATLVIGAPGESSDVQGIDGEPTGNAASDSGAVYVFERTGTTYREVAFIKASNADAEDDFGGFVALDGDTLAVSAVGEATVGGDGRESNELAPDSGAVYVFERDGATWAQTAYLKPADPAEKYYFGAAIGLNGDTLAVGALGDADTTRTGAVYVYRRTANGFRLESRLIAPAGEANDRFGAGVALSPTLPAAGADGEASDARGINGDRTNNRVPGAGAVFLYSRR